MLLFVVWNPWPCCPKSPILGKVIFSIIAASSEYCQAVNRQLALLWIYFLLLLSLWTESLFSLVSIFCYWGDVQHLSTWPNAENGRFSGEFFRENDEGHTCPRCQWPSFASGRKNKEQKTATKRSNYLWSPISQALSRFFFKSLFVLRQSSTNLMWPSLFSWKNLIENQLFLAFGHVDRCCTSQQ